MTRTKALRLALASYLTTAEPGTDWLQYGEVVRNGAIAGCVQTALILPDSERSFNARTLERRFSIRLLVAEAIAADALSKAEDYADALFLDTDCTMRMLWQNGLSGTYAGVELDDAFKGIVMTDGLEIRVNQSQDGGAIATITTAYRWGDRTEQGAWGGL